MGTTELLRRLAKGRRLRPSFSERSCILYSYPFSLDKDVTRELSECDESKCAPEVSLAMRRDSCRDRELFSEMCGKERQTRLSKLEVAICNLKFRSRSES